MGKTVIIGKKNNFLRNFLLSTFSFVALIFVNIYVQDLQSNLNQIKKFNNNYSENTNKKEGFLPEISTNLKILKKKFFYGKTFVINYGKLQKLDFLNRLNKDLFFISLIIEKLICQGNQEILHLFCQIRANIIACINHIENSKVTYE